MIELKNIIIKLFNRVIYIVNRFFIVFVYSIISNPCLFSEKLFYNSIYRVNSYLTFFVDFTLADSDIKTKKVLNRCEIGRRRILYKARDCCSMVYIDRTVVFLFFGILYNSFYLPIRVNKRRIKQKFIIVVIFYTDLKPNFNL